jgi:hypothetical protein
LFFGELDGKRINSGGARHAGFPKGFLGEFGDLGG